MLRFSSTRFSLVSNKTTSLIGASSILRRTLQNQTQQESLFATTTSTTTQHATFLATTITSTQLHHQLRFSSQTGFENPLHKKLDGLINQARIVVFLTGTPSQPRCGFTVRMVEMLEQLPIKYEFVNIMEDEEVCEGLKTYSQWPTYPQLYIDGELIGGWDITRQMVIDGSLIKILSEKKLLLED